MRRGTVRTGIRLLSAGVLIITVATFANGSPADALTGSPAEVNRLYLLGLFWGGAFGGCGIAVAVIGAVLREKEPRKVSLLSSIVALLAAITAFALLSVYTVNHPRLERLRPGETISI